MSTATAENENSDLIEARNLCRPVGTPQTTIVTITPDMAAYFIEKNSRNRSVRPNTVNAYARVMTSGGWQLTGEGLKFDINGHMIDGQHRCLAIIKADVPVTMTVTRGLNAEAQSVMDSGIKRTAQDYFLLSGTKNSAVVAAIARLSLKLLGAKSPTNAELIQWAEGNPQIHVAAEIVTSYRALIDIHPSVLGVAWMHLSQMDLDRTQEFFDSIAMNRTSGLGDPRNALIRRMTRARRSNERLSQEAQLSLVFRAWNAWATGESLQRLPIESRSGNIKVPDPVPYGTARRYRGSERSRPSNAARVAEQITEEDYATFEWPTPPEQSAQQSVQEGSR